MKTLNKNEKPSQFFDTFISFHTEELRATHAYQQLSHSLQINHVMVLTFDKVRCQQDYPNLVSPYLHILEIDRDLSTSFLPTILNISNFVSDKKGIGIDISSMPIPIMAQVLHLLYVHHKNIPISFFYSEPLYYSLNNLFDYSSYNGEIEMKAIPGFEGESSRSIENKRIAIWFMGFETRFINSLITQEVNPDQIIPVNGFPSYFPKYKDISLINSNTNFFEQDIEIVFTEANNPFKTFNTLELLREKYSDYSLDVIPVGSKPMALGACLFALKDRFPLPNCRIIFPFPTEYKSNLNTGCGVLWEYLISE